MNEQIKNWIDAGHPEIAKTFLMKDKIKALIAADYDWLHQDTFDLNPHLIIRGVCTKIAEDITVAGIDCKSDEVMLYWLSVNLFNKNDNLSLKSREPVARFGEVDC